MLSLKQREVNIVYKYLGWISYVLHLEKWLLTSHFIFRRLRASPGLRMKSGQEDCFVFWVIQMTSDLLSRFREINHDFLLGQVLWEVSELPKDASASSDLGSKTSSWDGHLDWKVISIWGSHRRGWDHLERGRKKREKEEREIVVVLNKEVLLKFTCGTFSNCSHKSEFLGGV